MEVRAVTKYTGISPQKARLVLDEMRGRQAEEALTLLQFMPQQAGESLGIRPNPAHLRTLGLVTWEADRADRVEAAHSRIREGLENQLAAMDSSSTEAAEVRAQLRRAAEARHVLLQRLPGNTQTD